MYYTATNKNEHHVIRRLEEEHYSKYEYHRCLQACHTAVNVTLRTFPLHRRPRLLCVVGAVMVNCVQFDFFPKATTGG